MIQGYEHIAEVLGGLDSDPEIKSIIEQWRIIGLAITGQYFEEWLTLELWKKGGGRDILNEDYSSSGMYEFASFAVETELVIKKILANSHAREFFAPKLNNLAKHLVSFKKEIKSQSKSGELDAVLIIVDDLYSAIVSGE
jgi:hypothetical protein